jgi:hypothetical protein
MSECPATGVMGIHSDAYHEDEPAHCAWCGAANPALRAEKKKVARDGN